MRRLLLAFLGLALHLPHARGDKGEWRVAAGGGLTLMAVRVGGASGTGAGYDARARLAYGLSNMLEVGLVGGYTHASDTSFDEAALEGQTGKLFADLSTIVLGAELRWTSGLGLARAFERTSPYVAARAGGAVVLHTSQQLFTESGLLLLQPKDDWHFGPFAGVALGVEHRFGDHIFLAGEFAASVVGTDRLFGLNAEAAWSWY
jgi:hypothetical protein